MRTPAFITRLRKRGWEIGEPEWAAASHTGKPTRYRLVKSPRMRDALHIEVAGLTEKRMLAWERSEVGYARFLASLEHIMDQAEDALRRDPDVTRIVIRL